MSSLRSENGEVIILEELNKVVRTNCEKVAYDDVIAISFSADIDEPNKVQTKDGNWHNGVIIDPPKGEERR